MSTLQDAEYCWVVDPIDGTRAFIMGQPLWGTLIGVVKDGRPLLELMDQPFTGERFWSGEHQACSAVMAPSGRCGPAPAAPNQALLASTSPDLFAEKEEPARFEVSAGPFA